MIKIKGPARTDLVRAGEVRTKSGRKIAVGVTALAKKVRSEAQFTHLLKYVRSGTARANKTLGIQPS